MANMAKIAKTLPAKTVLRVKYTYIAIDTSMKTITVSSKATTGSPLFRRINIKGAIITAEIEAVEITAISLIERLCMKLMTLCYDLISNSRMLISGENIA